ncbi:MAG: cysteine desulfurase NifS, partial [Desulfosalsimonas sp.]
AGAACHSDTVSVSHVLEAMGLDKKWAKGTIRLSTGRMTTEDEIGRAAEAIAAAVRKLRA